MSPDQPPLSTIDVNGREVACRLRGGSGPALLFLPGYASDMDGAKAVALDHFAAERGLAMLRFDYSGTGSSGGDFEAGTLTQWLDEALAALDRLVTGPVIAVGSSMGGWLALHLALRRPDRVQAVVGIAAAPDFTDWGFTPEQREVLARGGRLEEPNPFGSEPQVFTSGFWESGQALGLFGGEIAIDCPVRLVHGERDEEVPLAVALRTMAALRSADVQLLALKAGGHRLSEPQEIQAILRTVDELLEPAS